MASNAEMATTTLRADTGHTRSRHQGRPKVPAFLLYALIALLAWLPLPIGGHADWAASLAALLVGGLLLLWCGLAWRRGLVLDMPFVFLPAILLVAGVVGWSMAQAMPGILPADWAHPIWRMAAEHFAAGQETMGTGGSATPVVALDRSAAGTALMRLIAACGVFLLAFAVAQREEQARQLLLAILAITMAYAVFGILQELIGWRLADGRAYRGSIVSTFVNRNHFATYANLGLLIALSLMLEPLLRGRQRERGERLSLRIARAITTIFEERRYPLIAAVILLLALIGSKSRGGFLSLLGAGLFLLLVGLWLSHVARSTKLLAAAAALGFGGLVLWLTGDALLGRFQAMEGAGSLSELDSRILAWTMTLQAIAERPFLGHGHGGYLALFHLHHDAGLGRIGIFDHAHNDYLQLAAELGLPAAIALLMALFLLWALCVHGAIARRYRRVYPLTAAAAGILVALHAIVDFSLLMPSVALTFAAILGIGCAQSRATPDRRS